MASCPACGADIIWAVDEDGEKIPLEKWTDTIGSRRYRIVEIGSPLKVAHVSPQSVIDAYPHHHVDCPAHGNGLAT